MLCQFGNGFGKNIYPRSSRNIVDYYRCFNRIGNGFIVLYKAASCSLVVVWSHNQKTVDSDRFCKFAHLDCVRGVVASGSGNNGYASADFFHRKTDCLLLLAAVHGCGFSGCSADNKSICRFFNLPINQFAELLIIYTFVLVEGSDNRNA